MTNCGHGPLLGSQHGVPTKKLHWFNHIKQNFGILETRNSRSNGRILGVVTRKWNNGVVHALGQLLQIQWIFTDLVYRTHWVRLELQNAFGCQPEKLARFDEELCDPVRGYRSVA